MKIENSKFLKKSIIIFLSFCLVALVFFCALIYKENSKIALFDPSGCQVDENIQVEIDSIQDSEFFIISGYAYIEGKTINVVDGCIVLYCIENERYYKIPTQLLNRPDLNETMNDGVDYSNCGFIARVSKHELDFSNLGYEICYYYNHDNYNAFVHSGYYMGSVSEGNNE